MLISPVKLIIMRMFAPATVFSPLRWAHPFGHPRSRCRPLLTPTWTSCAAGPPYGRRWPPELVVDRDTPPSPSLLRLTAASSSRWAPCRLTMPGAFMMPSPCLPAGHRRAADECATEHALGAVTMAWTGLSALAAGLRQQCQVMDREK
jgi:hypothetical protein